MTNLLFLPTHTVAFRYDGGTKYGDVRIVKVNYVRDMLYDILIHGMDIEKQEWRSFHLSKIAEKEEGIKIIK